MQKLSYRAVNAISAYRIIAAPVMLLLIFTGNQNFFKWLLPLSFCTDILDGYLARKYKVISILGAKLDSLGDDLTILVAISGLVVFKLQFVKDEIIIIGALLSLFAIQNILALIRYGKITSFHTLFAKAAALLQGTFLILMFLLPEPVKILFYAASVITILDLTEEIILVLILPRWEINVKGLYWALKRTPKNPQ